MKIKNDSSVIKATSIKIEDGMLPHRLVLRHLTDSIQPYVTHCESMRFEQGEVWIHDSYFWGHYFSKKEDAEKDFEERKYVKVPFEIVEAKITSMFDAGRNEDELLTDFLEKVDAFVEACGWSLEEYELRRTYGELN